MKKVAIFAIVILVILIAGAAYWMLGRQQPMGVFDSSNPPYVPVDETATSTTGQKDCAQWYNEIDSDLQKANYCQADADCEAIILGGEYIEFGCYHFVNKAVDKQSFLDRVDQYSKQCSQMIDLCVPTPTAKCIDGKCTAPESEIPADPAAVQ